MLKTVPTKAGECQRKIPVPVYPIDVAATPAQAARGARGFEGGWAEVGRRPIPRDKAAERDADSPMVNPAPVKHQAGLDEMASMSTRRAHTAILKTHSGQSQTGDARMVSKQRTHDYNNGFTRLFQW